MNEPGPRYKTVQTLLFDVGSRACTDPTLAAAVRRAMELRLGHLVVASTTGWTGERAVAAARKAGFPGRVVVVAEHTGYRVPGQQLISPEVRRRLEEGGAAVLIATHALSSVSRSFRFRWGGIDMAETIAETLRRVSRGTKVCVEMAVMAADAGLIPTDRDVVAAAGSGHGADTAVVLRAANMNRFFDLKLREFIALPRFRASEVLVPAVRRFQQGMAPEAIAAELDVAPDLVREYLDLFHQVEALRAEGVSLAAALEQVGAEKVVALSLRELLQG